MISAATHFMSWVLWSEVVNDNHWVFGVGQFDSVVWPVTDPTDSVALAEIAENRIINVATASASGIALLNLVGTAVLEWTVLDVPAANMVYSLASGLREVRRTLVQTGRFVKQEVLIYLDRESAPIYRTYPGLMSGTNIFRSFAAFGQ